jgi:hypothetical protein
MKFEKTVTIDMRNFGISTVVSTKQSKIDWYMNEYATQPDEKFGGGSGKFALMIHTYDQILNEDKHFSTSVNFSAAEAYERWQYFLDGCIIYATLNAHFSGKPVPLVSDTQFADATLVSAIKINDAPDSF